MACTTAPRAAPKDPSQISDTAWVSRGEAAEPELHGIKPTAGMQLASIEELSALDLRARIGAYEANGAAWVPSSPIAVNRDFDIATALSLDGIGAGVAAARRRNANIELAQQLSGLRPIEVDALLKRLCDERDDGCTQLDGARLRIYAMLFGAREPRLRVVLERAGAEPPKRLYAAVSGSRSLSELAQPGTLELTFESELRRALALLDIEAGAPLPTAGRCSTGDSSTVAGQVIERDAQHVVLLAAEPKSLLVHCPADAFRE